MAFFLSIFCMAWHATQKGICCLFALKQLEAERSRVSRRASTSWEEETDIKTLEYVAFANYLLLECKFELLLQYIL